MKTFIVAALLVATVAGQSLDILKLTKEPTTSMLKFDRPVSTNLVQDYVYGDDFNTYNVMTLQEIMVHPRFQEYMTLPLFRQYFKYEYFQRYVCSAYFQRFWHLPQFQQYFVSPVLFYKYIYPIVNVFRYDYQRNTYNFPYNYNYDSDYYYGQYDNLPVYCRYNTVYCKNVVEQLYQHLYQYITRVPQEETMMPYNYDYNTRYNPIIAKMMYGYYNKQYPFYNRFQNMETDNVFPYTYNKVYDNVYPTTRMMNDITGDYKYEQVRPFVNKMVNEIPTEVNYDQVRPMMNKMNMGMKTFEGKTIPEVIKA